MKLILASASARRQELLKRITENFKIIVSDFDEDKVSFCGDFQDYVIALAKGKAQQVALGQNDEALVIGCDTIVAINDRVLGKPKDKQDAYNMLKLLSGNTHKVYSGIAIINTATSQVLTDYAVTEVKFSSISDEEIWNYIESGDPMDKAGAYGIQGKAAIFIEEIHGCYYNVVGLPLNKLYNMLDYKNIH
ncbi:MAG: Maf-like protein [Bacillota bacterium]|nr:Maf-like protein [Bacillota bacterium]